MTELWGLLGLTFAVFVGALVWALRARSTQIVASAANTAVFRQRLEELRAVQASTKESICG